MTFHHLIQLNEWVAIRLPSDLIKVEQIVPNTTISLGKYGQIQTKHILGRPYHLTYELLESAGEADDYPLRVVSAAELHADALIEQTETTSDAIANGDSTTPDNASTPGESDQRNNKDTLDDPASQKLTMQEIEALKDASSGPGREIIEQLLQSHSAIDQKTAFSLAKYRLRKNKKYLKRFCILPLDTSVLAEWMLGERDAIKIMELRNETIGLLTSWANVHHDGSETVELAGNPSSSGRWLIVDDTGGLMVAAVAEKMGILHPAEPSDYEDIDTEPQTQADGEEETQDPKPSRKRLHHPPQMSAPSNSITLLHSNNQPNLSLLKFFSYDANDPSPSHPLYTHLRTLSWLQLLSPAADPTYKEPEYHPVDVVSSWKSSKRSAYWRKRRRWERIKNFIDETRAGGFTGLLVASWTSPTSILRHTVPLLAGGAQVVVYTPHIEPLVELVDLYSTARRTAFINTPEEERTVLNKDFPLDPTLLLGANLQTARIKRWQTLPGRTHPLMMSRGGAEGYVFHATRVLPAEGKVEARGNANKRRKVDQLEDGSLETDPAFDAEETNGDVNTEEIQTDDLD